MMQKIHLDFIPMLAVLIVFLIAFSALMYFFYKCLKKIQKEKEKHPVIDMNHFIYICFLFCGVLFLIDIVLKLLEECHVCSSPAWVLITLDVLLLIPMIVGMFFKAIHNLERNKNCDDLMKQEDASENSNTPQIIIEIKVKTWFYMLAAAAIFITGIIYLCFRSSDYMICFNASFMLLGFLSTKSKKRSKSLFDENSYGFASNIVLFFMLCPLVIECKMGGDMDMIAGASIANIVLMALFYFFCAHYLSDEDEEALRIAQNPNPQAFDSQLKIKRTIQQNQDMINKFMEDFNNAIAQAASQSNYLSQQTKKPVLKSQETNQQENQENQKTNQFVQSAALLLDNSKEQKKSNSSDSEVKSNNSNNLNKIKEVDENNKAILQISKSKSNVSKQVGHEASVLKIQETNQQENQELENQKTNQRENQEIDQFMIFAERKKKPDLREPNNQEYMEFLNTL